MKPKWMPQVLKTIEKDAPGNAVAQRFLVEVNARAESVAAVKGAQSTAAASVSDAVNESKPQPVNQQRIDELEE